MLRKDLAKIFSSSVSMFLPCSSLLWGYINIFIHLLKVKMCLISAIYPQSCFQRFSLNISSIWLPACSFHSYFCSISLLKSSLLCPSGLRIFQIPWFITQRICHSQNVQPTFMLLCLLRVCKVFFCIWQTFFNSSRSNSRIFSFPNTSQNKVYQFSPVL